MVDIAQKVTDGKPTDELAIVVFVAEKEAPESLPPDEPCRR